MDKTFKKFDKATLTRIIIAVLIIVVLILPFKLPYKITVPGKVFPTKEWLVVKGTDGRLMTSLINHKAGVLENYAVRLFERGDAVQFSFNPNIVAGSSISTNDTIGIIYSNESQKKLINLKADLGSQKARLDVSLTDEKEAVVSAAKQGVEYAERQFIEQQKIYNRQKGLYNKNLISIEEFDLSKGALDLFRINIEIARERYNSVTTGAKQEEIDLINTKIEGLQLEIGVLEQRFSDYVIQSPIDGIVNRVFSSDTLMIVSDTTEFIVLMPIEWSYREYVKKDQTVEFDLQDRSISVGKIVSLGKSARLIDQNIVSFVFAAYSGENVNFMPGLLIECSIICDELTPRQHIFRFMESLLY